MAITSADQIPDNWAGTWTSTWQRTYTVCYRVQCDDSRDGPMTLRNATEVVSGVTVNVLPLIGTSYFVTTTEKDLGAFANSIEYRAESTITPQSGSTPGIVWLVTYQYGPYDPTPFGTDPSLWPLRITFTGDTYQKTILVDYNGNPVLNSALCPYEDPVQVDDTRAVITVKRNELIKTPGTLPPGAVVFDPTIPQTYRDTVNSGTWNGFAAKWVKINSITTGDEQYDSNNQVYYYEVTYVFSINRDIWQSKILDQGKQILDSGGFPTPLLTAEGQEIDEAVLLNGSGARLASGGTPVFATYDVYSPVDFSPLAILFSAAIGR